MNFKGYLLFVSQTKWLVALYSRQTQNTKFKLIQQRLPKLMPGDGIVGSIRSQRVNASKKL
jgi:hypothetical protein